MRDQALARLIEDMPDDLRAARRDAATGLSLPAARPSGNCVEVAAAGRVLVRDTRDRSGLVSARWRAGFHRCLGLRGMRVGSADAVNRARLVRHHR